MSAQQPNLKSASRVHGSRGRRVLMVARGLDAVGTGRQIEVAAAGFHAAGWQVHLAMMTAGGDVATRLSATGATVHRIAKRPVVDAAAVGRLLLLARRLALGQDDAILAWGRSQAVQGAMVKASLPAARLVSHLAVRPRGLLMRWALGRADRVVASSPAVAAAWERAGGNPAMIDMVPPAADAPARAGLTRDALAARLGLDPGKLWTLCVAPLVPDARLERLLWAIDQLGVVHRNLEHVLVGAGPLRTRILRRARVQQLAERLHLVSHLDGLPDLVREVRLVWQSGEVACGGAILDGMALGIPAVAVTSDSAGQLIVDGETGRIVPAEPESEFPRRALGILEDDTLAARYGDAARSRADAEFPAARMVDALITACS